MSKRRQFIMSDKQHKKLMDACQPVAMIALQCGTPRSPQENANNAWESLGKELGFQYMTVEPGRSPKEFTAIEII